MPSELFDTLQHFSVVSQLGAHARQRELGGGQQAAQLVVQLARQVRPLVFTHRLQVARQHAQVGGFLRYFFLQQLLAVVALLVELPELVPVPVKAYRDQQRQQQNSHAIEQQRVKDPCARPSLQDGRFGEFGLKTGLQALHVKHAPTTLQQGKRAGLVTCAGQCHVVTNFAQLVHGHGINLLRFPRAGWADHGHVVKHFFVAAQLAVSLLQRLEIGGTASQQITTAGSFCVTEQLQYPSAADARLRQRDAAAQRGDSTLIRKLTNCC